MISVLATIEVPEGRREDFLKIFRELVPKVLAEDGCVEYGPWTELPTSIPGQSPPRDDVVTVIEKWESIEALETHLMAPHMPEFRQATEDLRLGIKLQILEPA